MRYDKTERLGVIATVQIVTKDIGWIFREQSVIDVGLDAIIEEVYDGNPTGKFLAVQIKSGKGNFFLSDKKIIYYVSNIHYNYWLNLNIPIILIAHFPETEKTYWCEINEHNLKRTKKQWKLEIPMNQEFNSKAKNELASILSDKTTKSFVFELYKGQIEPDSIYDIIENAKCISDSRENIVKIIDSITELRVSTDIFNEKLGQFSKKGLSDKDLAVSASIKGFARTINITAKRIENEIVIFSKLYSVGFYAFEQVILLHYLFTKDIQKLADAKKSVEKLPPSIDFAIEGISEMRNGILHLPNKFGVLKEAKLYFLEIIDMIINEYSEAKMIAETITENLRQNI